MKHLFFNNVKAGHAQIFFINPDKISYACIFSNNLQYNKILLKNLLFLGIYIPYRKLFIQIKMISCLSLNRALGYAFCHTEQGKCIRSLRVCNKPQTDSHLQRSQSLGSSSQGAQTYCNPPLIT